MTGLAWKAFAQCTMLGVVATAVAARADFYLSVTSALGGGFGINPDGVHLSDFDNRDDNFDGGIMVGGHYVGRKLRF